MLVKSKRSWEMPERDATPESLYFNRRQISKGIAAGSILAASGTLLSACSEEQSDAEAANTSTAPPTDDVVALHADRYPAPRNTTYALDRDLTPEDLATTYNNFYEFGTDKRIWRAAQALVTDPWSIEIGGMVDSPRRISFDELMGKVELEERLYRHRCVEAWSMAVPWTGFPLSKLIDLAAPLSSAKYVRFETLHDPDTLFGQRAGFYDWPYVEGLTIAEATHDLAFIATGLYGQAIPKQNGAPLRLVLPWKYGFKSIKSIVRMTFTDERPKTFWEISGPREYGFWANVNPEVAHRRWSQAQEEPLGVGHRVPTLLFNGYAEEIGDLYAGLEREPLFM
jgi:sulfoxide reductase catalytic subunit YedY